MEQGELGRVFQAGEIVFREGDEGDCMFVIQEGEIEVFADREGREVRLAVRGVGEVFGEMALLERSRRSASVRALTRLRAITVDRKSFLRRVHEDPSLAFRVVETLSRRLRDLTAEVARLKSGPPPA